MTTLSGFRSLDLRTLKPIYNFTFFYLLLAGFFISFFLFLLLV